jgi:alcohol dehydrogenase (cytochrome c)
MRESTSMRAARAVARTVTLALAIAAAGLSRSSLAAPEEAPVKNPRAGDALAIVEGGSAFRLACALCHGLDARGGARGPDLVSGPLVHGDSDAALFATITEGVPGTEMPPAFLKAEEVWAVVAYLRTLTPMAAPPPAGDRAAGEKLFFGEAACARCHMIDGRGGRLGPDLSRIGAARPAAIIAENIRTPSQHVSTGYETVTAVTRQGKTITGVRRNEDTFSLQLMDAAEAIHLLQKDELREVAYPEASLMPDYPEALLDSGKLRDLVAYLASLRGDRPAGAAPSSSGTGMVRPERLLAATSEPAHWLTYSGDYAGWRYSRLAQIDKGNVQKLGLGWVFQPGMPGKLETTPLVVDGLMFVTGPDNHVWALDPRAGRAIWHYQRRLPEKLLACCGRVNRGLAALGDRLFLATLDAHVVALDAKTGSVLWDVEAADYRLGHSFTLAPLAVKDKIIVGVAGGEYGIRGFIDAYEAQTGRRAWRFYTIPGPGERGYETWEGDSWKTGGAPAWLTGTYDAELNLTYWGIGNPGPDAYGSEREGDNLYSDSVVALDVDTGALKWHFQYTPHDVHDWDATQIPVLVDRDWGGRPRKLLFHANRNGFFYVLDRSSGELLLAKPFARVNWAKEIGPDGRPVVVPGTDPTPEGTDVCPGVAGATNFMSPAYSPQTGLLYVATREQCDRLFASLQAYRPGGIFWGSAFMGIPGEKEWGALRALDPETGTRKWEFRYQSPPWGGALATSGGLVFAGDMEGYVMALDAATGKLLWRTATGGAVFASPMSYAVEGRQFVALAAGGALFAFALPEPPLRPDAPAR